MTPEEHRALDAEVHLKVMGKTLFDHKADPEFSLKPGAVSYDFKEEPPPYSQAIDAAWEVVEKLASVGLRVTIMFETGNAYCDFEGELNGRRFDDDTTHADVLTVPHAICVSALKAVEAK